MTEPLGAETIAALTTAVSLLFGVQNACDWLVEKNQNIRVGAQRDAIDTCIDRQAFEG
jgi:hypothetical protein